MYSKGKHIIMSIFISPAHAVLHWRPLVLCTSVVRQLRVGARVLLHAALMRCAAATESVCICTKAAHRVIEVVRNDSHSPQSDLATPMQRLRRCFQHKRDSRLSDSSSRNCKLDINISELNLKMSLVFIELNAYCEY